MVDKYEYQLEKQFVKEMMAGVDPNKLESYQLVIVKNSLSFQRWLFIKRCKNLTKTIIGKWI